MKLFAEIETLPTEGAVDRADAYPVRLSREAGVLTFEVRQGVETVVFDVLWDELGEALVAIGGNATRPAQTASLAQPVANLRSLNDPYAKQLQQAANTAPPQFADMHEHRALMRARPRNPKPEADVA